MKEYTFENALAEIGQEEFAEHYRTVFDVPILDYTDTVVINLPEPCFANCAYCIDKDIRAKITDNVTFLKSVSDIVKTFPHLTRVSITGGTMNPKDFNTMLTIIKANLTCSDPFVTWNTNGIGFYENWDAWKEVMKRGIIKKVNLHRDSTDDEANSRVFCSHKRVLALKDARELFGDTLTLRITMTKDFEIKPYLNLRIPLYLNAMLPFDQATAQVFQRTVKKLGIHLAKEDKHIARRNAWINTECDGIPIRICMGDRVASRHPNRKPVFMNVVIIHRNGIASGTWFDDDKVIYRPETNK